MNKKNLRKALSDVKKIENYLKGMGLTLHPKKRKIQPIQNGLDFLGFTIYGGTSKNGVMMPGRIVPGERIRRNMRRVARQYKIGCKDGESLIAYKGLTDHFDNEMLLNEVLEIIY